MSANHTPEPWHVNGKCIVGATPVDGQIGGCHDVADTERACACVNACAGIPTKVLEDLRREPGDKPFGTTTIREICKDAVELINDPHAMSHIALEAMLRELEVLAGEDD